jgi:hypothetical protein
MLTTIREANFPKKKKRKSPWEQMLNYMYELLESGGLKAILVYFG